MMKNVGIADIAVGDSLPELSIDVTARLIVGAAIASRDYQDVHHDKDAAQSLGTPDIFMNILTTNGLVGRYVTDWAGPDALVKGVAIKLGGPNLPGDTMKLTGSVTGVDGGSGEVEVTVSGKNAWGSHVDGTVRVALPRSAS